MLLGFALALAVLGSMLLSRTASSDAPTSPPTAASSAISALRNAIASRKSATQVGTADTTSAPLLTRLAGTYAIGAGEAAQHVASSLPPKEHSKPGFASHVAGLAYSAIEAGERAIDVSLRGESIAFAEASETAAEAAKAAAETAANSIDPRSPDAEASGA